MRSDRQKGANQKNLQLITPDKMVLYDSIKKSMNKSINKLQPSQYKNILKGDIIYLNICYKGKLINTQYKNLIRFMGGTTSKNMTEKVTIGVVNEVNSKINKKFNELKKPLVNVLWLEACFNEKKRLDQENFIWKENERDEESEVDLEYSSFDYMISDLKHEIIGNAAEYEKKFKPEKYVKFITKKEKTPLNPNYVIPQHQIEMGIPSEKVRKSEGKKRRVSKIYEHKSTGSAEDILKEVDRKVVKSDNVEMKNRTRIVDKYLTENQKTEDEEPKDTPHFHSFYDDTKSVKKDKIKIPEKIKKIQLSSSENLHDKVDQVNLKRIEKGMKEIKLVPPKKNIQIYISNEKKLDCLFAAVHKPKVIVGEQILSYLQTNCDNEIPEQILHQYEIPYKLNDKFIKGKSVTFTDSVQESKILMQIVNMLGGKIIQIYEYLFNPDKVDLVICNRKGYMKIYLNEIAVKQQKLIDSLIQILK